MSRQACMLAKTTSGQTCTPRTMAHHVSPSVLAKTTSGQTCTPRTMAHHVLPSVHACQNNKQERRPAQITPCYTVAHQACLAIREARSWRCMNDTCKARSRQRPNDRCKARSWQGTNDKCKARIWQDMNDTCKARKRPCTNDTCKARCWRGTNDTIQLPHPRSRILPPRLAFTHLYWLFCYLPALKSPPPACAAPTPST
eukprot:1142473-Pelagomonas_calceolata.AAC.1